MKAKRQTDHCPDDKTETAENEDKAMGRDDEDETRAISSATVDELVNRALEQCDFSDSKVCEKIITVCDRLREIAFVRLVEHGTEAYKGFKTRTGDEAPRMEKQAESGREKEMKGERTR